MFKRDHHLRIATVLQALDAEILDKHHCLFGEGSAIVLERNEYRESIDIDFLISNKQSYQELRSLLREQGLSAITRPGLHLKAARELRADQHGIRTMLLIGEAEIKFEIILEARIELSARKDADRICGVSTLSGLDMATTKLLANSDRWADDSVFSRDLIDLAMIGLNKSSLKAALKKAEGAYGTSAERDLTKAIANLERRKGRLEECMEALKIEMPKALLWKHIRSLKLPSA